MDYYKEKQFITEVNDKDEVVGKVEKWEAHKKGILHRGYTAIITYNKQLVLQHRKHPVFDNVFDLSFSSHQLYEKTGPQKDVAAILDGLQREWNIHAEDIVDDITFVRKVQYKAFDDISGYYENEMDYIYTVELGKLPEPNFDFCYGFYTLQLDNIEKLSDPRFYSLFAPWVGVMLKKPLF